jgi:UDP-N-acetylglucosamine acyltransferase
MRIHPTAIVDAKAELAEDVTVGPFCIIEADVVIGSGCEIRSHSIIHSHTTLGQDNKIGPATILGGPPQDLKFHGEKSELIIGARNIIREGATVHRATGEDAVTRIGDDNYLMATSHVGHNCTFGNGVTLASFCGVSGFVTIEDFAIIGGMSGLHQYTTVGTMAMVAAMTRTARDVPPYMIVEGNPGRVRSLNVVGLRRRGIGAEAIASLKAAYGWLFAQEAELNVSDAIARVRAEVPTSPELENLLTFLGRIGEGSRGRQAG